MMNKDSQNGFFHSIPFLCNEKQSGTFFVLPVYALLVQEINKRDTAAFACKLSIRYSVYGPVAPTSLNFKSYLSPDLRTIPPALSGS